MKEKIREDIIQKLLIDLNIAKEAFTSTKAYALSEDLKNESKYDTRAIEAKYLAEAQEVRTKEIESDIEKMKSFIFINSQIITVGSIVELENYIIFILPISGQGNFKIGDQQVKTISYSSVLAKELIGLKNLDYFEHPISGKEVQITKIL